MAGAPAAATATLLPTAPRDPLVFLPCDPLALPARRGRISPGFRCLSCSTNETSVMRAGPAGPKTLCNKYARPRYGLLRAGAYADLISPLSLRRCGLRYRKQLETESNVRKRMSIATLCADKPASAGRPSTSPREGAADGEGSAPTQTCLPGSPVASPTAASGRRSPLGVS